MCAAMHLLTNAGLCAAVVCFSTSTEPQVRIIVDRPIIEVYVLGGRIAWAHQDNFFNASATSVHLYNAGRRKIVASNVSAYGMSCGWRSDLPPPRQR